MAGLGGKELLILQKHRLCVKGEVKSLNSLQEGESYRFALERSIWPVGVRAGQAPSRETRGEVVGLHQKHVVFR